VPSECTLDQEQKSRSIGGARTNPNRAALLELSRAAQRARVEVTVSRARLVKDIAESRELIARADFLLTLPHVR